MNVLWPEGSEYNEYIACSECYKVERVCDECLENRETEIKVIKQAYMRLADHIISQVDDFQNVPSDHDMISNNTPSLQPTPIQESTMGTVCSGPPRKIPRRI